MKLIILSIAMFANTFAYAGESIVTDQKCVPYPVEGVKKSILTYENYAGRDEQVMNTVTIPFVGQKKIKFLDMIKAQDRTVEETDRTQRSLVWTVLQPLRITNGDFYPQFMLDCHAQWESNENGELAGLYHRCGIINEWQGQTLPRYGLDKFNTEVLVQKDSSLCDPGQTYIYYNIELRSVPQDVEEIKKEALKNMGFLAPIINMIFDENKFFTEYIRGYYEAWITHLPNEI